MNNHCRNLQLLLCAILLMVPAWGHAQSATETLTAPVPIYDYAVPGVTYDWQIVVNNGVVAPGDTRTFNSYNPPSLNLKQLVVFRGRTKGGMQGGGGEPTHGVFVRDMATGTDVTTVFDRKTAVPQPNNIVYAPDDTPASFIEPPAFPRIGMWWDTIATRANHQPVWTYLPEGGTETRSGTTGVYTNPFGSLITGASNLGAVPDFSFWSVPGTNPPVRFDVFPGAPSVTDGLTIVFKGNFTDGGVAKTGVYYRNLFPFPIVTLTGSALEPAGGMRPVIRIADTSTYIPGTRTPFGSTAPPSAAGPIAVFAGFDNEENPTKGGIYRAPLTGPDPKLKALVTIGQQVPGEGVSARFNRIGEALSFDGRFVAFWGAWGTETVTLTLQCPTTGNKPRIAYCNQQYPNGFETTVPKYQGIFVYDTVLRTLNAVAKAPKDFTDFVYWNFSGKVAGSEEGDDGEPARWRSASFVAVSGLVDCLLLDKNYHVAFKARQGQVVEGAYTNVVDGIYLRKGPDGRNPIASVVQTGVEGTSIDPGAVGADSLTGLSVPLPITGIGIERDGFRGDALAVNVSMGTEAAGWAGIYLTTVPARLK